MSASIKTVSVDFVSLYFTPLSSSPVSILPQCPTELSTQSPSPSQTAILIPALAPHLSLPPPQTMMVTPLHFGLRRPLSHPRGSAPPTLLPPLPSSPTSSSHPGRCPLSFHRARRGVLLLSDGDFLQRLLRNNPFSKKMKTLSPRLCDMPVA